MSHTEEMHKEQLVAWAREQKEAYRPHPELVKRLAETTFILIVGPTAIGKSHIIQKIIDSDPNEFSVGGTVTSRQGRDTDPENYRADISVEELVERIKKGELLQYDVHPTTHEIYATDEASFATPSILIPALSSSIRQFQKIDLKKLQILGLLASGDTWQKRLEERRKGKDFPARLEEAVKSTRWIMDNTETIHVWENKDGEDYHIAEEIIRLINNQPISPLKRVQVQRLGLEIVGPAQAELRKIAAHE